MRRILFSGMSAAAVFAGATSAAAAPTLQQKFFLSPAPGSISCELDYMPGATPTQAYCQSVTAAQSVTLLASGKVKICHGQVCLGNPPQNDGTLAYGRAASLGPFTCTSQTRGVTCRVSSGRGFRITRSGVKKVS